nr:uncharacterized protein LOC123761390 [Procambarus clarkii]
MVMDPSTDIVRRRNTATKTSTGVVVWVAVSCLVGGALASTLTQHQHHTNGQSKNITNQQERDGKFIILAKIARVQCTTTDSAHPLGTCMPIKECASKGGNSKGSCAGGLATCCVITKTCNEATSVNNTYFVNPDANSLELGACTLTINHLDNNICQMRFDFITLDLSQPDSNGICTDDFLTVTGGVSSVPMICGYNSGQHIYYDVDPNGGAVKLTVDRSAQASLLKTWNIKVSQIACDSRFRAPVGCLQYYTTTAGTVSSFNFLNTNTATGQSNRQLSNQDYGICIKRADNYCGITWEPNNVGGTFGFTISGAADALGPDLIGTIITSSRDSDCTTDYVVIPGGMYTTSSTSTVATPAGRYCGLGFPPSVTTTSQPFILYVKTDDNETRDTINRGFRLNYRQITSCA